MSEIGTCSGVFPIANIRFFIAHQLTAVSLVSVEMKIKKNKEKPLNPFELHINNKKFTILGRKSKNEVGKPGTARSKSIQKVSF